MLGSVTGCAAKRTGGDGDAVPFVEVEGARPPARVDRGRLQPRHAERLVPARGVGDPVAERLAAHLEGRTGDVEHRLPSRPRRAPPTAPGGSRWSAPPGPARSCSGRRRAVARRWRRCAPRRWPGSTPPAAAASRAATSRCTRNTPRRGGAASSNRRVSSGVVMLYGMFPAASHPSPRPRLDGSTRSASPCMHLDVGPRPLRDARRRHAALVEVDGDHPAGALRPARRSGCRSPGPTSNTSSSASIASAATMSSSTARSMRKF